MYVRGRVVVDGPSMLPTLEEGDRLLVVRSRALRPGDLVVFNDPELASRLLVKRVEAVSTDAFIARGDNDASSRDSRSFGDVPRGAVLGRAVYRYAPPGRTGRLRRSRVPG